MTSLLGTPGLRATVALPVLPVESWPLVASSVMDPLVVSDRSVHVATPASAVIVSVPPRLPAEPAASPSVTGWP